MKNVLKGLLLASCLVQPAQAQMGHVFSKDQSQQRSQQHTSIVDKIEVDDGEENPHPQQIQIIQPLQEDDEESDHPQNQANRRTNRDGEENRIQQTQQTFSNNLVNLLPSFQPYQGTMLTNRIVVTFEDLDFRRNNQHIFYRVDLTTLFSQLYFQHHWGRLNLPVLPNTEEEVLENDSFHLMEHVNPMALNTRQQLALPSSRDLDDSREPRHTSLLVQPYQQVQEAPQQGFNPLSLQQQHLPNQRGVFKRFMNNPLSHSKL